MKSDEGKLVWFAQTEWGIKIADSQSDWTPLQRRFMILAQQEYGPDNSDMPSTSKF